MEEEIRNRINENKKKGVGFTAQPPILEKDNLDDEKPLFTEEEKSFLSIIDNMFITYQKKNHDYGNMEVDVKYTTWGRYTFDDSIKDEVLARIKKGEHPDDIKEDYATNLWIYEDLLDTSEPLTVNDNQGFSTIEVGDRDEHLYKNGE